MRLTWLAWRVRHSPAPLHQMARPALVHQADDAHYSFTYFGVPGDRALAVNDVQADQQRDAQPGLLDRDPLQRVDRGGAARPEDGPDTRPDPPLEFGRVRPEHDLHLRELLVPRHQAQQLLDAAHGA